MEVLYVLISAILAFFILFLCKFFAEYIISTIELNNILTEYYTEKLINYQTEKLKKYKKTKYDQFEEEIKFQEEIIKWFAGEFKPIEESITKCKKLLERVTETENVLLIEQQINIYDSNNKSNKKIIQLPGNCLHTSPAVVTATDSIPATASPTATLPNTASTTSTSPRAATSSSVLQDLKVNRDAASPRYIPRKIFPLSGGSPATASNSSTTPTTSLITAPTPITALIIPSTTATTSNNSTSTTPTTSLTTASFTSTAPSHSTPPVVENFPKDIYDAARQGYIEAVKFYLSLDPSIIDKKESTKDGVTPLHCAAQHGHFEIAEYLIKNNAKINSFDNEINYPLHWACFFGYVSIVKLLLENGAFKNIRNKNTHSPLHLAVMGKQLEVVKLLIKKGASITSQNNEGLFPIDVARKCRYTEIAKYLEAVHEEKTSK